MSSFARRVARALVGLAVVAGAAATAGCDESTAVPARVQRSPMAKALGIFSTRTPADPRAQGRLALEQDAFRRESRFLEGARPGYLFRATRVEQGELEAGLWSNEEMYQLGGQLFHVPFTKDVGFGGADLPALARFHRGRRGGPDAHKCATCHWRGGLAGAGDGADNAYLDGDGDSQDSALERNPPALHGAGLVELLAQEMTRDLANLREGLIARARREKAAASVELLSKGVSFGFLDAKADGSLDTSRLAAISPDLIVRPFGWKGSFATIRDIVEDSLNIHHGMQSEHFARTAGAERAGNGGGDDPDGDGATREITEGQTSVLSLFVAMQETPLSLIPTNTRTFVSDSDFAMNVAEGRRTFERLGCVECHRPALKLESSVFRLASRAGGKPLVVDLGKEAAEPRVAAPADGGGTWVELYSDLRRHDMGPELRESRPDRGVAPEQFLTRPLWGLARSKPYLHDGRTVTVEDAILAHGGEALPARNGYVFLPETERLKVRSFLASLGRARRLVAP